MESQFKPVLFAYDRSILIKNPSFLNLKKGIINIFEQLNKWFGDNLLALNFDKLIFFSLKLKIVH
jgi:hypothetical protein